MAVRRSSTSLKPYGFDIMAQDTLRLMDHLGMERADIMGYSMGGRVATQLALTHPDRVRALIMGGVGANLLAPTALLPGMAEAMEAADIQDIEDHSLKIFRGFAEFDEKRSQGAGCLRTGSAADLRTSGSGTGRDANADLCRNPRRRSGRSPPARGAFQAGRCHRHSGTRSQPGRRRPGLQAGRAGVPDGAALDHARSGGIVCTQKA